MENSDQSFNKLFEQYMFTMAVHLIDKLGKPDQDKLIQFLIRLNAVPPTAQSTPLEVDPNVATNLEPVEKASPKSSRKSSVSRLEDDTAPIYSCGSVGIRLRSTLQHSIFFG